tara:strand:+ start:1524 stop:2207 length:684 start_codon:yes stop_codon:yes gene_type:complete
MKWYLFNTKTSQKISGQGEDELVRLTYALGEAALWNWVAHIEGHNGWKRLREMGLHLRYVQPGENQFPKTPNQQSGNVINNEVAGFQGNEADEHSVAEEEVGDKNHVHYMEEREQSLIVDQDKEFLVREHSRYDNRYKVVIETNGNTFVSHSQDVSVGGILLEDALPDWVVGYCNVRIIKQDKREEVQLMCSLVESDDPTKKRFRIALAQLKSLEDESVLDEWLRAG